MLFPVNFIKIVTLLLQFHNIFGIVAETGTVSIANTVLKFFWVCFNVNLILEH